MSLACLFTEAGEVRRKFLELGNVLLGYGREPFWGLLLEVMVQGDERDQPLQGRDVPAAGSRGYLEQLLVQVVAEVA